MDLELLKAASAGNGSLPVIVVTAFPSVPTAIEAVRCAVVDYLVKPFDFDQLVRAVRQALKARSAARMLESLRSVLGDGGTVAQIARRAATPGNGHASDALTPREREIVSALATGQRVGSIAERLGVSEHTVRNHLKAVYRKLDVHSQVELLSRFRTANPRFDDFPDRRARMAWAVWKHKPDQFEKFHDWLLTGFDIFLIYFYLLCFYYMQVIAAPRFLGRHGQDDRYEEKCDLQDSDSTRRRTQEDTRHFIRNTTEILLCCAPLSDISRGRS
jgi:DNA-binding NarL/FixJ family response regulator